MKKRVTLIVLACVLCCMTAGCDKSTAIPAKSQSGTYYTTYSNIMGPPANLAELGVKGPFYVSAVVIEERSTEEELARVDFSKGQTIAVCSDSDYNTKYWVERIQNAEGQTVSVKVSSTAANDFFLTLELTTVEKDIYAYWAQCVSDDGVHSPEGAVISDPYQDPELPIAGVKYLNFKCDMKEGSKIKDSLSEAGYNPSFRSYADGTYTVSAFKKSESRGKIEQTVLKPKGWDTNKEKSKGNVGFYSKADDFTGKINIDWTFSNIPFTIEINDAKLEKLEDGEDEISYTMSGTAEMKQTSFSIDDVVFKLKDKQKKNFSQEYGFKIKKDSVPAVMWDYVESWEYVSEQYGTAYTIAVTYTTGNSPTDLTGVPVKSLSEINGTDTMSFMMPAYGGTATWSFEPEK